MKSCPVCGSSNNDASKFCADCGHAFTMRTLRSEAAKSKQSGKTVRAADLAHTIQKKLSDLQARRRADIMFVLDCTGSMRGELDAIRDAILDFAQTISGEGVRARVGLIEFRDRFNGEEHRALLFAGHPFTDDPAMFRREVSKLKAEGGDDIPESSLDAVMLALRQPFDETANKVIVLVTDAPPHVPDVETGSVEEVARAVRRANVKQFCLVIKARDSASQVYLKLLEGAQGGLAFDMGEGNDFRTRAENFKRTLMSLGKTISTGTK
jgi:Mg-chelatase subunit ChlD